MTEHVFPEQPVDGYTVTYWSVLSRDIVKSTATYYAHATAAEVWPGVEFYRGADDFEDDWLVNGWSQGRIPGWANIANRPGYDRRYWTEQEALAELHRRLVAEQSGLVRELADLTATLTAVRARLDS